MLNPYTPPDLLPAMAAQYASSRRDGLPKPLPRELHIFGYLYGLVAGALSHSSHLPSFKTSADGTVTGTNGTVDGLPEHLTERLISVLYDTQVALGGPTDHLTSDTHRFANELAQSAILAGRPSDHHINETHPEQPWHLLMSSVDYRLGAGRLGLSAQSIEDKALRRNAYEGGVNPLDGDTSIFGKLGTNVEAQAIRSGPHRDEVLQARTGEGAPLRLEIVAAEAAAVSIKTHSLYAENGGIGDFRTFGPFQAPWDARIQTLYARVAQQLAIEDVARNTPRPEREVDAEARVVVLSAAHQTLSSTALHGRALDVGGVEHAGELMNVTAEAAAHVGKWLTKQQDRLQRLTEERLFRRQVGDHIARNEQLHEVATNGAEHNGLGDLNEVASAALRSPLTHSKSSVSMSRCLIRKPPAKVTARMRD